jgi:hypothetical protein
MRESGGLELASIEQLFDTGRMAVSAELRAQLSQIAPVVLAAEQILPVPDVFQVLLPGGGLQRGWTLHVSGDSSARALAWGLLGGVTTAGGWVAAVNVPGISLAAAQEVGVAIERVLVVSSPPDAWAATIGALIGAVDVVVFGAPNHRITPSEHRRMASRSRERGSVLLELGSPNPGGYDAQLQYDLSFDVQPVEWVGLGEGHGCLLARELDVTTTGRRIGGRPRSGRFALPGTNGTLEHLGEPADLAPVRTLRPRAR